MLERRFAKILTIDEQERSNIIKTIKSSLLNRNDVIFAYLYGSFAEGSMFRDIDLAIFIEKPEREIESESNFSYELTQLTGYPVDVRIINRAPVAFQMSVLRVGILLFNSANDRRTDFIEDVSRRYMDYSHFRNIALGS